MTNMKIFDFDSIRDKFEDAGIKLRGYQEDAVQAVSKRINECFANGQNYVGQIVAPCAAGKTFMASVFAIICFYMNFAVKRKRNKILVVAPKIMLLIQLMVDYMKMFEKMNLGSDVVPVLFCSHTDTTEFDKELKRKVTCTTSLKDLRKVFNANPGKTVMVISTYHSSFKLSTIPWDMMVGDEAHFAVEEQFSKPQKKDKKAQIIAANEAMQKEEEDADMVAEKQEDVSAGNIFWSKMDAFIKLFITATPRHTRGKDEGARGMQNALVYGEVDYSITPKELVSLKQAVPTKLAYLSIDRFPTHERGDFTEADRGIFLDVVSEAFAYSYDYFVSVGGMGSNKLLVTCNGVAYVKEGMNFHKQLQEKIRSGNVSDKFSGDFKGAEVDVLGISSTIGAWINDREVSRAEFFKHARINKSNMIILHYDILAEGMDVGDINSVLLLRENGMTKTKTVQTVGRAMRKADNKDCCMIFTPIDDKDDSAAELIKNYLIQLRSAGYDPTDKYMLDGVEHSLPTPGPDPIWDKKIINFSNAEVNRVLASIIRYIVDLDDDELEAQAQIEDDERKETGRKKKNKKIVSSIDDLLDIAVRLRVA